MTGSTVLLIVHQHAEEAGFLAVLRDYAVSAPHYNLDDLSKLDDRLEAHLDGLRIAAPSGLETLLMRLGPHAIGEVFASTVLAFESANAQVLSRLSEHLRGAVETERGYLMALGWLDWERVSPWIDRLLASPSPCSAASAWPPVACTATTQAPPCWPDCPMPTPACWRGPLVLPASCAVVT